MLTGLVTTVLAVSLASGVAPASDQCSAAEYSAGVCQRVSNSGSAVEVSASDVYGGANGSSGSASGGSGSPGEHVPELWTRPDPGMPCDSSTGSCLLPDLPGEPAEPAEPGFPDVTVADLVSFRPVTPELAAEPEGFGVVGMPANFVAAASAQEVSGTLLGYPVRVRFEPTAFVFSYGDGEALRAASGGASWTSSGSPQFTPTPTSHVYADRGTYTAGVTVEYAAWVDFGTGWRPVDGVVSAASGGYAVEVVEVRTALVDKTCAESPVAAGCG